MADYAFPVLYALLAWWFSTGLILYLDGLPRHTFRWSMAGATAMLGLSLYGLARTSTDTSVVGAYLAFTCGVMAWGWQEISFLMGYLTGPRSRACPRGCGGWRHVGHAIQTILYHELAILAGAVAIVTVTWGGPNQVGTWTFVILWIMRLSAKVNVFLGVRNLNEEFLPENLQFLRSFFKRRPMNLLFPLSVTASTVALTLLVQAAIAGDADHFQVAGLTFLAALVALALLEHWFLVLPLPVAALWRWAMRSRGSPGQRELIPDLIAGHRSTPCLGGHSTLATDPCRP